MLKQSYHAAKASVSEDADEQKLSIHCHLQSAPSMPIPDQSVDVKEAPLFNEDVEQKRQLIVTRRSATRHPSDRSTLHSQQPGMQ